MTKIKKLQPMSKDELRRRVYAIGTCREVAEMLGYEKSTLQKFLDGERKQSEKFLYRFRDLEREIENGNT